MLGFDYDRDGRLHVASANLTRASVDKYRGSEIVGWRRLGLDRNRVYQMLRAPDELRRAVSTFNGLPLVRHHRVLTGDSRQPDPTDVIGTTGSNAEFADGYIRNSLHIWSADAIDGIANGEKSELSAGYAYRPVMRPGVFRGTRYDGIMRDISPVHICLVGNSRVAGTDLLVGDGRLRHHQGGSIPTAAEIGWFLPRRSNPSGVFWRNRQ